MSDEMEATRVKQDDRTSVTYPKTTSSAARSLVHSMFRLPPTDVLYDDFACTLMESTQDADQSTATASELTTAGHGRMYATSSAICFYAEGKDATETIKKVLPFKCIESLSKHSFAWVVPSIALVVVSDVRTRSYLLRGFFGSSRGDAFDLCTYLHRAWRPDLYPDGPTAATTPSRPGAASVSSCDAKSPPDAEAKIDTQSALRPTTPSHRSSPVFTPPRRPRSDTPSTVAGAGILTQAPVNEQALREAHAEVARGVELETGELAVSPERFWSLFVADDAEFGALDSARHAGYSNISVGSWQERRLPRSLTRTMLAGSASKSSAAVGSLRATGAGTTSLQHMPCLTREIRFQRKLTGILLVSSTRVEQTQTLHRICDSSGRLHILLRTASRSLDVPYGDTFEVLDVVFVKPGAEGGCSVSVTGRVEFESRGLLSQRIESLTLTGIKPAVKEWFRQVAARAVADGESRLLEPNPAELDDHVAPSVQEAVEHAKSQWWEAVWSSDKPMTSVADLAGRAGRAEEAVAKLRLMVIGFALVLLITLVMVSGVIPAATMMDEVECWTKCGRQLLSRTANRIDTLWEKTGKAAV